MMKTVLAIAAIGALLYVVVPVALVFLAGLSAAKPFLPFVGLAVAAAYFWQ